MEPETKAAAAAPDPSTAPRDSLAGVNLQKNYQKRSVLQQVSLTVRRGEAVALLGPNGAGKTTCFHLLAGLLHPDGGSILLDGRDITSMSMYRRARAGIGFLPQESSIFRGLTVEQNLMSILQLQPLSRAEVGRSLHALLEEFAITHLRQIAALALSGGERRRVEIARALASRPSFIMMDEPLAGVDPIAVGEIRELILHLKKRGIGILITDHNVRDTLSIVDRAYILHGGRILIEGPPAKIVEHSKVRSVYLGEGFSL
ncbi:MAG: LPS export ABC transporter ATP-binding protein [Opitutaceae bacterium]|nr:LPS export ABC transporter ATP-binding protein [Opitutaceae bacterium]